MKRFFVLMILLSIFLISCEASQPIVYTINKSDELLDYESEMAEESKYEEDRLQESIIESQNLMDLQSQGRSNNWQKQTIVRNRVEVKGVYITDITAGSDRMNDIIKHIDETVINAVVIDIKNDDGRITYAMDSALITELGSVYRTIPDLPTLMETLKAHDIYVIARVVTFRDPYIETQRPEWMIKNEDGSVYHDSSDMAWINPYNREYWEYLSELVRVLSTDGFDEVQFDYVRFCTEGGMSSASFTEDVTGGHNKTQIITEFVQFMSDCCAENNIFMSTDVFGTIIDSYVDAEAVGQNYSDMSCAVDYMCPMIYPSHYSSGYFGIESPDTQPYATISAALSSSSRVLASNTGKSTATVRPWLQGFTASYLTNYIDYGVEEMRAQIQAVYNSGQREWLVWNASNNYIWSAFTE